MKPHIDNGFLKDHEALAKEKEKPFLGYQKKCAILYRQREGGILAFFNQTATEVMKVAKLPYDEAVALVEKMP